MRRFITTHLNEQRAMRHRAPAAIAELPERVVCLVLCLVLCMAISGCESERDDVDTAASGESTVQSGTNEDDARGQTATDHASLREPAAPSEVTIRSDERPEGLISEYDWDATQSIGPIRATRELMNLLRALDVWHRGELDSITITWHPPGYARDPFGNELVIVPEEWKGILELIPDRAKRSDDGIARWRAMPHGMYNDGHGPVTRQNYRVFIETHERLRFENEGPTD